MGLSDGEALCSAGDRASKRLMLCAFSRALWQISLG